MIATVVSEREVVERELDILKAMVATIDDYLRSDVVRWELGKSGLPPMTLGGSMMRLRRLAALRYSLYDVERTALDLAQAGFDRAATRNVVRFEQRAYQELNARLREWTTYLRDLTRSAKLSADKERYAVRADIRILITELVEKLAEKPYRLDGRVPRDVAALDRRLKLMWEPGPFVLAQIWKPVYPPDAYWWLYGSPKSG